MKERSGHISARNIAAFSECLICLIRTYEMRKNLELIVQIIYESA